MTTDGLPSAPLDATFALPAAPAPDGPASAEAAVRELPEVPSSIAGGAQSQTRGKCNARRGGEG